MSSLALTRVTSVSGVPKRRPGKASKVRVNGRSLSTMQLSRSDTSICPRFGGSHDTDICRKRSRRLGRSRLRSSSPSSAGRRMRGDTRRRARRGGRPSVRRWCWPLKSRWIGVLHSEGSQKLHPPALGWSSVSLYNLARNRSNSSVPMIGSLTPENRGVGKIDVGSLRHYGETIFHHTT
jgi:hypothetical protein